MLDPDLSRKAAKLKDRPAIISWTIDGDDDKLAAAVKAAEGEADLDFDGKVALIEKAYSTESAGAGTFEDLVLADAAFERLHPRDPKGKFSKLGFDDFFKGLRVTRKNDDGTTSHGVVVRVLKKKDADIPWEFGVQVEYDQPDGGSLVKMENPADLTPVGSKHEPLPGLSSGDPKWDKAADKAAIQIRRVDPGNDPEKYVRAGKLGVDVVEKHPEVKAAKKRYTQAKKDLLPKERAFDKLWNEGPGPKSGHDDLTRDDLTLYGRVGDELGAAQSELAEARQGLMDARADAVRQLVRRVRPTGEDTGDEVDMLAAPGELNRNNEEIGPLIDELAEQSKWFPASWIKAANDFNYGDHQNKVYNKGALRVETANPGEGVVEDDNWFFNPNTGALHVHDGDYYRAWRIHEMMHAIEQAASKDKGYDGMGTQDERFLGFYGHMEDPPDFHDILSGNRRFKLDGSNRLWDPYSGTDYYATEPTKQMRLGKASELLSTGMEYLYGNSRDDFLPKRKGTPWDKRYRLQVEYALGMLLRGGPADDPQDLEKAGIPPLPPLKDFK